MSYTSTHTDYRKDGRNGDIEELEKGLNSPDPIIRKNSQEAAWRIRQESDSVRNMREALIAAHKRGDVNEVKNIQWDVVKNSKYQTYK